MIELLSEGIRRLIVLKVGPLLVLDVIEVTKRLELFVVEIRSGQPTEKGLKKVSLIRAGRIYGSRVENVGAFCRARRSKGTAPSNLTGASNPDSAGSLYTFDSVLFQSLWLAA